MNTIPMKAQQGFEHDALATDKGTAELWFIGHGTLIIKFDNLVIHVDPYSAVADYGSLPKADLILITHQHGDHLDLQAIDKIKQANTFIICNKLSSDKLPGSYVMQNGDTKEWNHIKIEAVAAYNIKHERAPGKPFHPEGEGNGYVLTLGDKKVYIAGDTEDIPEMTKLKDIDVAFLPMNLPYTMTPEMVASAIKMFNPKVVYPYHYGDTDASLLISLVDSSKTEIRIRNLR